MLARFVLAAFFLGHAAIHVGFVSARPPATPGGPAWPFTLDRSWALTPLGVDPGVSRTLGPGLVMATIGGFALAAIAALGFLPAAFWSAGAMTGAQASIALLLLFFQGWLVLGLAIDLVVIWAVLVAQWAPDWLAA